MNGVTSISLSNKAEISTQARLNTSEKLGEKLRSDSIVFSGEIVKEFKTIFGDMRLAKNVLKIVAPDM